MAGIDYSPITELPGVRANSEQLARMYHRYRLAAEYCAGLDVLEVACGGGQGLDLLARSARCVVGGDYMFSTARIAAHASNGRIPVVQLDAQAIPLADNSFDAVLLFEAIYYLANPGDFLDDCHRLLRSNGMVFISAVNADWQNLNPSPFSTRYYSATDLSDLLGRHGFKARVTAAFADEAESPRAELMSRARKLAIRFGLIPKSFKYKALLKRLVYGRLTPVPATITADLVAHVDPEVTDGPDLTRYKILYAVGTRV